MGEFCNPSPWCKVTEAGADQTPCSWKQQSRRMLLAGLHHSQPWVGRAGTCPGQTQGRWLVLTCLQLVPAPGNGCSSAGWGQAQPAPRDGGTYRDTAGAAPAWPVSCRAWAGRDVWILPGLLRPCSHLQLDFLPVRLDGAPWLPRCLHPLASWTRAKEREGTPVGAPSHASGGNRGRELGAFPSTYLPGLPSATQCPGGSWWIAPTAH